MYMHRHWLLSVLIIWLCSHVSMFLFAQANNYNVEICQESSQTDEDTSSDGMSLKLLSKKLVCEDLQHFRAPSVEDY